ncbi:amidohydrolase [Flavivirga spongiicola]|uniref:Amidohydrolase n=1 Tax=Flavivirga spongiicola TaxID=421621 RepID=A0ABU7XXD7_9FLAO|nr:amidohydrolase [Flavivirga sp. MEBiC05379]MDO5980203.1 amidohydrolase [Flavivirga sp. MEBiC05379]
MKTKGLFYIIIFLVLQNGFSQERDVFKLIEKVVEKEQQLNLKLYKHLHQNPELSFQEKETSKRMALELKTLGFDVTEGIGGYGVVGVFKNGSGPTIMLRTDLDALPLKEKTGLSYASTEKAMLEKKEVSVMHACGHDIHMVSFIGTAKTLIKLKAYWSGTLFMLAQPAEERGGAKLVLNDGLFEKFSTPDYALAYHVSPTIQAGKIGYTSGPAWAKVNTLEITVRGLGGHGAKPHKAIDPIVLSSRIILAIQTITSREISAIEPAVITVGAIHGGSKHNIIPEEVHLMLTLRSCSEDVALHMINSIQRICNGVAESAGLPEDKYPIIIEVDESLPPGINDPELTARVADLLKSKMDDNIIKEAPVMSSEDFYRFGNTPEHIPLTMLRLGSVSANKILNFKAKEEPLPSLHSSFYAPDPELTIKTGIVGMSFSIIKLMEDFNNKLKK